MTRRSALPALAAVAALTFAGCGGAGSSEPVSGGSSGTSAPSVGSTGTASAADGVRLTPQGTHLALGDTARVMWHPTQTTTGVAAITVTGLLEMPISTFRAWRLNRETRRSTPYFVHATVRNLGHSDLSHTPLPLYLLDQRETLLRASRFQARFTPCPSRPLPPTFKHGDRTTVCLVYFVPRHGKLVAISFRPTEDFSAITWQGHVVVRGRTHRRH